ncbi:MAG: hypothetical protein KY475_00255 [Planctomycetes bacterium]|nr:hypothetical protein [Planctomycetota bacterium]
MENARVLLAVLAAGIVTPPAAGSHEIPLQGSSVIRFSSVEAGAEVLRREDEFTRTLSRFDLQSRLTTTGDVSSEDLRRFAARQVVPWSESEIEEIAPLIASLREQLDDFPPLFPETVLLIKTTGKEEGGAAYCRQNAIVLPGSMLRRPAESLKRLLAHELFHVLSRHNPELRDRLYAVVGFRPAGSIELPASLADRKITNPDAPGIEHFVELRTDRGVIAATPILFASVDEYDPAIGGSFFGVMQFRLMQLRRDGEKWRPARDAHDEPILLDPRETPAYLDAVGRNTDYIIHPEEVLADNFAHLLLGAEDLKTPRIVEELRAVLMRTSSR